MPDEDIEIKPVVMTSKKWGLENILLPIIIPLIIGLIGFIGTASITTIRNSSKLTAIDDKLGEIKSRQAIIDSNITCVRDDLNDFKFKEYHDLDSSISIMKNDLKRAQKDIEDIKKDI
ncbi:MAG: hypothetical protein PQJ50_15575 [Spirochaetales bacterium]|nr:hypothetical protein [Spirochaetales bacterium]